MTTRAYDTTKALARGIERVFESAVCSGIVGDQRHKNRKNGTYHLSRQDNPKGSFSVVRPDDKPGNGPDDAAAAVDISMNRRDMTVATRRLMALWADVKDPRRKFINAFNGWIGTGDAQRFDIVARRITKATSDHKWHLHLEVRRAYVLSGAAIKAILSALRGESVAQYLISIGVRPMPAAPAARMAAPPYPGRVLKRTASDRPDAAVKTWQAQMIARGWKSLGHADGLFKAKTEAVVRRFQKQCKVPDDGMIGPRTWPLPWTRPLG